MRIADLVIEHPYATPSLAGTSTSAAYFKSISNQGQHPDRLLGASTPAAERVELHRMGLDAGVMRMREVQFIDLPPQSTMTLRHGGDYHLMLVNLKLPLESGDRFPLKLNFERAGSLTVNVWVQQARQAGTSVHKH